MRRPRYRIRIYDEAHLVDRGSIGITWVRVVLFCLAISVIFIGIGIGIVWFTPLKSKLPGYLPSEQRARTEDAYLKVDSIQKIYRVHQAYLDNLVKLLNSTRNPDVTDTTGHALPLLPDSIMVSSEVEKEFIRKMEEAGYVIAITEEYEGN